MNSTANSVHCAQTWRSSTCLNGSIFWFTVPYKDGCLWRFGGTYCLHFQVEYIWGGWSGNRKRGTFCLYRKDCCNFGLPKLWLAKIFPNFAIQSAVPFPLLRSPEPDWLNLKTKAVRPSETLEQSLATHFETPIDRILTYKELQLWKPENFLYK